jgi:hypothetical protein
VSFFVLTPLPGSEDHLGQHVAGVPMDEDLNSYDSFQPVIDHPLMSRKQWQEAYNRAWRQFYTARQMTAALRRIQKRLLGDVSKFPLVPMECGGRGGPPHDGRIPSTQTLREPATVGGSDVADGAHDPRDLAARPVHWSRLPGILSSCNRCTSQAAPLGWLATEKIPGKCGSKDGGWKSAVRGGFKFSNPRRMASGVSEEIHKRRTGLPQSVAS